MSVLSETRSRVEPSPAATSAPRRRREWAPWLFVGPAVFFLAVTVLVPFLTTLGFSFTDVSFLRPTRFVGLQNYLSLFQDDLFVQSLWNTVYYTVGVTVPTILLGLGIALLLNVRYAGRSIFRAIFYLPVLVSIAAAAMVWLYLYNPDAGPLNALLQSFGVTGPRWLQNPDSVMPALIIMGVWRDFGTSMLLFLAGLQSVPDELKEAARLDGAGPWRVFTAVIMPSLRPVTLYVTILTIVGSFQVFGSIYIMTGGGPVGSSSTVVFQMYTSAFSYGQFGYSSAISVVLFMIILVFSIVGARLLKRGNE